MLDKILANRSLVINYDPFSEWMRYYLLVTNYLKSYRSSSSVHKATSLTSLFFHSKITNYRLEEVERFGRQISPLDCDAEYYRATGSKLEKTYLRVLPDIIKIDLESMNADLMMCANQSFVSALEAGSFLIRINRANIGEKLLEIESCLSPIICHPNFAKANILEKHCFIKPVIIMFEYEDDLPLNLKIDQGKLMQEKIIFYLQAKGMFDGAPDSLYSRFYLFFGSLYSDHKQYFWLSFSENRSFLDEIRGLLGYMPDILALKRNYLLAITNSHESLPLPGKEIFSSPTQSLMVNLELIVVDETSTFKTNLNLFLKGIQDFLDSNLIEVPIRIVLDFIINFGNGLIPRIDQSPRLNIPLNSFSTQILEKMQFLFENFISDWPFEMDFDSGDYLEYDKATFHLESIFEELLKLLILSNSPRVSLRDDMKEIIIKNLEFLSGSDNVSIHLVSNGMRGLFHLLSACKTEHGNKLKIAYFANLYHESQQLITWMFANNLDDCPAIHPISVDSRVICLDEIDVLVLDSRINYATSKVILSRDILEILSILPERKMSIILDMTLSHFDSEEIDRIKLKCVELSESGFYNIVFLQSLSKFIQIGMDKFLGCLIISINNPNFDSFNHHLNLTATENRLKELPLAYFYHLFKYCSNNHFEFIEQINFNCLYLYDQIKAKFIYSGRDNSNVVEIARMESPSIYIGLLCEDFAKKHFPFKDLEINSLVFNSFFRLIKECGLPITVRDSIGFIGSSINNCFTALRFVVGLEGKSLLDLYAKFINQFCMQLNNAWRKLEELPNFALRTEDELLGLFREEMDHLHLDLNHL